ncbi:MAG: hypothetical protein IPL78_16415 [Chloroflexi bacterium]|nr:hypothetical protein [Chloroflexota bacterium]
MITFACVTTLNTSPEILAGVPQTNLHLFDDNITEFTQVGFGTTFETGS